MKGRKNVQVRTRGGITIELFPRYYRRSCDRRKGKRYKGMYAGLLLLGIHDQCTPGLAAMVSAYSALLSSFEEVRQVLCDHGITLDVKVIRKLAYRYAERGRAAQQAGQIPLNEDDALQGRPGRYKHRRWSHTLREKKRRSQNIKRAYPISWEVARDQAFDYLRCRCRRKTGKKLQSFIDGCFNGPDGLFRLLKAYLESLRVDQADQVLFVADGAHWIWNRVPGLVRSLV